MLDLAGSGTYHADRERPKNAMLCCELVDTDRYEELMEVLEDLKREVEERLGGQCEIKILDQGEHKEAEL